jgi:tetratricopeptide (TPR) repeat protein
VSTLRSTPCLLLALVLAGCGVLTPPVARTVDGVTSEGRFIEPEAYALYSVAALREAHGEYREALELYQRALRLDRAGPEIRTRIAAVACKLREHQLADESFDAALARDPEYGPAWFELALCRKARADLPGAARAAERALELDPERYETSLLAADMAEKLGDHARAWQLRDALITHAPGSLQAQRAVLDAAKRTKHHARAARAQQALDRLRRPEGRAPERGVAFALRALARGEVAAARREAELLLGADPGNGDALVLALSAADLEQDHSGFARLLTTASEPGRPASPAVLEALEALLARRVSAQAAQLLKQQ